MFEYFEKNTLELLINEDWYILLLHEVNNYLKNSDFESLKNTIFVFKIYLNTTSYC